MDSTQAANSVNHPHLYRIVNTPRDALWHSSLVCCCCRFVAAFEWLFERRVAALAMNTRQAIDNSTGPVSLSASFNQDGSCFSVGLDTGFCGMYIRRDVH